MNMDCVRFFRELGSGEDDNFILKHSADKVRCQMQFMRFIKDNDLYLVFNKYLLRLDLDYYILFQRCKIYDIIHSFLWFCTLKDDECQKLHVWWYWKERYSSYGE